MSSPARPGGEVITFYSYKGGTGRSMALANVACLLARWGHSVLAIDWDLEAPGLHRFFSEHMDRGGLSPEARPGLIEMFMELERRLGNVGEVRQAEYLTEELAVELALEEYAVGTDITGLDLLAAGRRDEGYPERVMNFDWRGLFKRAPNLLTSLAEHLTTRYDYVLIDSRTGVTDVGGICTMLMPHKLIAVFTPNHQSLTGVAAVAEAATRYRLNSGILTGHRAPWQYRKHP